MATSIDPPSYESIMASFGKALGENATIQDILDAASKLPAYTASVHARGGKDIGKVTKDIPMNDSQKKAFDIGVAKTMSSQDALTHLRTSASEAVLAVNTVETMFINLTRDLAKIDSQNTPPKEGAFTPRLVVIHTQFRSILGASRALATKIATYGQRFDKIIIPICNDATLTTEQRKAKVDTFIADADTFALEAKTMSDGFDALKADFAAFTGSFSGWATDKEAADTATLAQARIDLGDLNEKLRKLEISLYALGGITAFTLAATAAGAMVAGPFAPFVIIGGLIAAGISAAATIALFAAAENTRGQIDDKEAEIAALVASIQQIKDTRNELEKLGSTNLSTFSNSIQIISLLWTSVRNDAVEISEWLAQGADDADMPQYMLLSVNEAVSIYQNLATYLKLYADGINTPA